ncbi:MAG: peptidase [Clostridia bacterium]|jgi:Zn-dependent protease|nr:peptidase [Clostridia bacterium]
MNDFSWIIDKLYYLPGVFIGLSFHEFSHGLAAYFMGDQTAKNAGRLTLNPRAHIDILGFLTLLLAGFGWAKPVPINPWSFKKRRIGTIIVSLAGPLMNLLLAFITLFVVFSFQIFQWDNQILLDIVIGIYSVNVSLFIFNLLPIPPLDGSKILASVLPGQLEGKLYGLERYSHLILLMLLVTKSLNYILDPLFRGTSTLLQGLVINIISLFY